MKIYQVQLKCRHLEIMKSFYTNMLEMELINESAQHFTVMAGTTKIIFEKTEEHTFYHVAFRTESNYFDIMFKKLLKENLLLPNEEGEVRMFWEGKQAYFYDSDGNVMEILERPSKEDAPLGWHDVIEVGWPSGDVNEMQADLKSILATNYKRESGSFTFFGDEEGVFVIVNKGRNWYPTELPATIHPIKVVVSGNHDTRYTHPTSPYEIIVRKEWQADLPVVQFRIARPTNQLNNIIQFYHEGLGLKKVGDFHDHEGYDGVMFGAPDTPYHLEFTQYETPVELPIPTKEHLLVFYIPNRFERDKIVDRLQQMGYHETEPENPYWSRGGVTIEDPDGWRIVLMNTTGI